MSSEFPLLFNSFTDFRELGSQFDKIRDLDNDRGLLLPNQGGFGQRDKKTEIPFKTDITQIPEKETLLTKDPNLQGLTMLQATQNVLEEARSRELTPQERAMQLASDDMLDPRVEDAIKEEAMRSGSNMYSLIPEDYVDDLQESVNQHRKEKYLFTHPDFSSNSNPLGSLLGTSLLDLLKIEENRVNPVANTTNTTKTES